MEIFFSLQNGDTREKVNFTKKKLTLQRKS